MRVLWFCNTPSKASDFLSASSTGGGWMSALQERIEADASIELGVAFIIEKKLGFKFEYQKTIYYPISAPKPNVLKKLITRYRHILPDNIKDSSLSAILSDFQPDIVHVFGTESGFGKVVSLSPKPAVIHLQGIANAILNDWFPGNISNRSVFRNTSLNELLRGIGAYNEYFLMKKRAKREAVTFSYCKYFIGRTDWDHNMVKCLAKNAIYFHANEMIREGFWEHRWQYQEKERIILSSILNPSIYKGFDIILQASKLLKDKFNLNFEWNIYGIKKDDTLVKLFENLTGIKSSQYNIKLHGPVDTETLCLKLKESSMFVHPSYIENSPNSVCEAMLLGVPVLAANVGGVPSLICSEYDGILFGKGDYFSLAVKIAELVKNKGEMIRLGTNARETARKRHCPERILGQVKTVYSRLLQETLINE
jgi:glycosyltransferase involved in cell wall biosynthesis